MPGLEADLIGRLTERDRSLVHVPPELPKKLSDKFVLSLTPDDLPLYSPVDFDRVRRQIIRAQGREYIRENSPGGYRNGGRESKKPLPNE